MIYSPVVFSDGKDAPAIKDVEQVKADLEARVLASRREAYTPAWQNDFNDLHIQSAALLQENGRLSQEHQSLQDEFMRLQKEIEEQENKNRSLQEDVDGKKALRDGKLHKKNVDTQQQRQKELNDRNAELVEYNRKIDLVEKKIALGRMKLKSLDVDGNADQTMQIQEELDRGNAELEENNNRATALKEKLEKFSADEKELNPAVLNLKEEIDALRLEIAALENLDRTSRPSVSAAVSAEEKINALTQKKADLQADLKVIQARMTKIKNSEEMGIANQRVKKLVGTISEVDAENERLREEARYLQENIVILKSHVKKLEYQADAINSMKGKMTPAEHLRTAF